MYMVSTGIGRSELEAWKYPLPQDSVIFMIHRVVVHLDGPQTVRLKMPPDPHRGTTTDHIAGWDGTFLDVRWSDDSDQLAFVSSSRDHKEAWLRVADPETGEIREVLHERVDTYFESGVDAENWDVLFESGEVLWYSERDNWGHLYMYDLATGGLKHQITSGQWAVQQVRRIDKENRVPVLQRCRTGGRRSVFRVPVSCQYGRVRYDPADAGARQSCLPVLAHRPVLC